MLNEKNKLSIKKNNIVSVSRRTDIPAFYGDWFINRIKEGYAGYKNPFNNKDYFVSLKKDDVICFVFWSNNFIPFMNNLEYLKNAGYNFYFNYTINNYPEIFEPNVVNSDLLIKNLKLLSKLYSKESINYRYDPIIISDITDFDFHRKNFTDLIKKISGYAKRCIFSYVSLYDKVKKNFDLISKKRGIKFYEPNIDEKKQFASELSDIAESYGIKLFSCCNDQFVSDKILKASCVDINLINELFNTDYNFKKNSTRKDCGCYKSIDIGAYNSCIHGCIYCYANLNKKLSKENFKKHDKNSVFLIN